MTKKQKIWLAVSLIMFLAPEFLWSPITNFFHELIDDIPYRDNLLNYRADLITIAVSIQFLGLVGVIGLLWFKKNYRNIKEGRAILVFFLFLALIVLFELYIVSSSTLAIL